MKKLILLRHADAIKQSVINDFSAEISAMGKIQLEKITEIVKTIEIDKVLVSPAKRTIDTLSAIIEYINTEDIDTVRSLYDSYVEDIINIIKKEDDKINNLMIIGHNPIITQLVLYLANETSDEYIKIESMGITTAQLLVLEFKDLDNWEKLSYYSGNILLNFSPNYSY